MDKPDADFLELCADWGALRGVIVRFERHPIEGRWFAVLMFSDTSGYFFSPPVFPIKGSRIKNKESMEEKRQRVYTQLTIASAKAHSSRISQITGREPAAKRA